MGVLSKTRIVLKKNYIRDLARNIAIEFRSNFNASTQSSLVYASSPLSRLHKVYDTVNVEITKPYLK